jgi:hypothetical protein
LTALRKQHPTAEIEDLIAEVERRWNETARIRRGSKLLCPQDIFTARMMATQLAWNQRHRIEGGVNAAAQMDVLLTIGEQLLMHVKPEVWTAKCVEMIQECGNSPQSRILVINNMGQLVITAAALVHPDCRALLPNSSGGAVAYRTETEYASSLLRAARSQGRLTDLYERDIIEWFNGVFRPHHYHDTFHFLPSAASGPTEGNSQKSQKSQNPQGS